MKKIKIFYIIGLVFFLTLTIGITYKNISLFYNNTLGKAIYEHGYAYLIIDDKATDESFRVYNKGNTKTGDIVNIIYNKNIENYHVYIVDFNNMLRDYLFMIIFIFIFSYLIKKDSN